MSGRNAITSVAAAENNFLAQLAAIVGGARVHTRAEEMAPFLLDWRGRYHGAARAVVQPDTPEEVAAVVRCCVEAKVPITPQGGNTSLCGAATPDQNGSAVVLNLTRLKRVRTLDRVGNTMIAEAGCTLESLQQAAADAGRYFPLSLASEGTCQLGGNVSTNAGGVHVLRYGNMRELTLGLEVVLPNGEIWHGLRALRKDNTGYDLKHLFIGAEGTLGVITAAALRLFPAARETRVAWLGVSSPQEALLCLESAQQAFEAQLIACELVSRSSLELVMRHIPGSIDPLRGNYPWYLLCQINNRPKEIIEDWLARLLESGNLQDALLAQHQAQVDALWRLRETIPEAQKIEGVSVKHDISLPLSAIPDFLARASDALHGAFQQLSIVAFGHLGDGNLHYNLACADQVANASFIQREAEVNRIVYDLVHEYDGSISAEHGLGQLKRETIQRYKSSLELRLMAQIKQLFDPFQLMNPGKIF